METKSAELNELFTALAKAQAEMSVAGLSSTNTFFKSKYADYAEIVCASRPALTKNGLAVVQQIISDGDVTMVHTLLTHSSGQWMESKMKLSPVKNDIQSIGSYISYVQRYCYKALVGVVCSDDPMDDDGEANMDRRVIGHTKPLEVKMPTVNSEQAEILESESEDLKYVEAIWRHYNISKWDMLPSSAYDVVKLKLRNHNKTLEELKGE